MDSFICLYNFRAQRSMPKGAEILLRILIPSSMLFIVWSDFIKLFWAFHWFKPFFQLWAVQNTRTLQFFQSIDALRQLFHSMAFFEDKFLKRNEASNPFWKCCDAFTVREMHRLEGGELLHAIRQTGELFAGHDLQFLERGEATQFLWKWAHAVARREAEWLERGQGQKDFWWASSHIVAVVDS